MLLNYGKLLRALVGYAVFIDIMKHAIRIQLRGVCSRDFERILRKRFELRTSTDVGLILSLVLSFPSASLLRLQYLGLLLSDKTLREQEIIVFNRILLSVSSLFAAS